MIRKPEDLLVVKEDLPPFADRGWAEMIHGNEKRHPRTL